jgi:hypothetical protein
MTKMARQGIKARHAIGIGMPSASAGQGIIIGMPSASACHYRQGIGKARQGTQGRKGRSRTQDAAEWRSIVIQILKEC